MLAPLTAGVSAILCVCVCVTDGHIIWSSLVRCDLIETEVWRSLVHDRLCATRLRLLWSEFRLVHIESKMYLTDKSAALSSEQCINPSVSAVGQWWHLHWALGNSQKKKPNAIQLNLTLRKSARQTDHDEDEVGQQVLRECTVHHATDDMFGFYRTKQTIRHTSRTHRFLYKYLSAPRLWQYGNVVGPSWERAQIHQSRRRTQSH